VPGRRLQSRLGSRNVVTRVSDVAKDCIATLGQILGPIIIIIIILTRTKQPNETVLYAKEHRIPALRIPSLHTVGL